MKLRFTIITMIVLANTIIVSRASIQGLTLTQIDSLKLQLSHDSSLDTLYLNEVVTRDWTTYDIVYNDSSYALISEYSSEVFISLGDTLFRQGWNLPHYALQKSSHAIYQNKLFAFGGYGYWTTKRILRYWDEKEGWIPMVLSPRSQDLYPAHNAVMVIKDSVVHIIGGEYSDEKNPFSRKLVPYIQTIDLKHMEVSFKEIDADLNRDNFLGITNDSLFFMDNGNLVCYNIKDGILLSGSVSPEIYKANKFNDWEGLKRAVITDSIWPENNIPTSGFIDNSGQSYYYILVLMIPLLFVLIIRRRLRNNGKEQRLVCTDSFISFASNQYCFNEFEAQIISYLNGKDWVKATEINSLIHEEISNSHKNKLRNEAIRNLNAQAKTISQSEIRLVEVQKDKYDLRMTNYRLNSDLIH